ncbi:MAG: Fur family transcriptional regulator [Acidimicrobiales bacterium]
MADKETRSTRQKRALDAVLAGGAGFRSAQDLYFELKTRGERIGLTTVYQQLKGLADTGEVDVLRSDDGETRYRRCDSDAHHHHLVCRSCGRAVEVRGPQVERWAAQIADEAGFRDIEHTVEVFGTCADC